VAEHLNSHGSSNGLFRKKDKSKKVVNARALENKHDLMIVMLMARFPVLHLVKIKTAHLNSLGLKRKSPTPCDTSSSPSKRIVAPTRAAALAPAEAVAALVFPMGSAPVVKLEPVSVAPAAPAVAVAPVPTFRRLALQLPLKLEPAAQLQQQWQHEFPFVPSAPLPSPLPMTPSGLTWGDEAALANVVAPPLLAVPSSSLLDDDSWLLQTVPPVNEDATALPLPAESEDSGLESDSDMSAASSPALNRDDDVVDYLLDQELF